MLNLLKGKTDSQTQGRKNSIFFGFRKEEFPARRGKIFTSAKKAHFPSLDVFTQNIFSYICINTRRENEAFLFPLEPLSSRFMNTSMNTSFRSQQVLVALVCITLFGGFLQSCTPVETNVQPPTITKTGSIVEVKNLNASSEDRFTLFNLRTGAIVQNRDSATSTWDVGFRKTSIIVNGGAIRTGKGAGLRLTEQAFETLRTIPTTGFRTDESEENLAFTPRTGQSWYIYDATVIRPIENVCLVVRCADGQTVAKIQILSYYKDAVQPDALATTRFYTFRYQLTASNPRAFD
ncbi:MAG: hypothetical protein EAZ92_08610 [Candidatus Kapaibacterium sp.]|nr:MAG: hypothetical protein EAZ92_08610 [Candidatus Kapabacteria bacterium]